MTKDIDGGGPGVIVVGAGPTGLLLAGDLAEAGVPVTLVEKRHPGLSNLSRALVVHATTLEAFDARGIADDLIAKGAPVAKLRLFDTAVVDVSELPTPYPYLLVVPQYETEAVLHARLERLGVGIRYETEVVALAQDADGVTLTIRDASGTHEERAAYVVGTDGSRSSVRSLLGVEFPGHTVVDSVMLVDARLAQPPETRIATNTDGDKFAFVAPFKDGYHRLICWDQKHPAPETEPVDVEEVRGILRETLGTDFGLGEPRWSSRFHSDERQAERYRVGRVFLAGDAAHLNPPFGGHGLNTGVGDAVDLGWKLAAVLAGWGGERLLDSYEIERRPLQERVIAEANANMQVLSTELLADNLGDADEAGGRAREAAARRIQETKRAEFHSLELVLEQRIGASPVIPGHEAADGADAGDGAHGANGADSADSAGAAEEAVGRRLAHGFMPDCRSLFDLLGPDLTLLVGPDGRREAEAVEQAARQSGVPLTRVDLAPYEALTCGLAAPLVLVRPDQIVAWQGAAAPDARALIEQVRGG